MRPASLLIATLAIVCVGVSAEPREADAISAFERALNAIAVGHQPEHIAAARSHIRTMTTACDPGTPCALCSNEMDRVTDGFVGTCYYSFSGAGENSQSSRDFYCSNQCYRYGLKYIKVIRGPNCQAFLATVPANSFGALTLTTLAADMSFACVKNPASGSYCSVALGSPPFNSSLSFTGGVDSPGCAALNELGCCWQSLLTFLNSTGSLVTFGMSSRAYALRSNSAICGLDLAPGCPVPGIATKYIQGVIAIRNLKLSYIVAATRYAVNRALAQAIYNSILNHTSATLNISPASVLITGISSLAATQSAFRTQVITTGVSVSFQIQAPTPEDTQAVLAPTQAAMASPVLDSLNTDLPSAAKYDTAESFTADPTASTAASVTTPDGVPSAAPSLTPSLAAIALVAVGTLASAVGAF